MLELKKRVYAANMELYRRGLALYTWGNVSEIDREAGVFAIKPSGVPYEELTEDMIVLIDLITGERVDSYYRPSSDTPTHAALYRAFSEIGGITHSHSTAATAWAQAGRAIPCLGTTHADYFHGEVPVARVPTIAEVNEGYELNTGTAIIEAFENINPVHTPGVLCSGHGPFAWGKDAAQSVYHAVVLEEVAKIAMYTYSISPDARPLPAHILEKHFSRKHGAGAYYGQ